LTDFALSRTTAEVGDRLQLLLSLGREIERAMDAICKNRLDDFEESVANQRELGGRLESITPPPAGDAALRRAAGQIDPPLAAKLRAAAVSLQQLNRRYAILLSTSGQTVAQMSSLFRSYRGHIAQSSGDGLKHQTASWQV
jgi:hypothetical protein